MIERPEQQIHDIAAAGADSITIHFEATPHVHYTLGAIREAGCTAGVAICPATPAHVLDELAADALDLALCMSVNPGWGGQQFIPASLDKLARMRAALPEHVALEVDGGVHDATAEPVSLRPARTGWSPARRCSAPTIRGPHTPRSSPRRALGSCRHQDSRTR